MRVSSSLVVLALVWVVSVSAGVVPEIGAGSSVTSAYLGPSGSPTGTSHHQGGSGSLSHPSGTPSDHAHPSGSPTGTSLHQGGKGAYGGSGSHSFPSGTPTGYAHPSGSPAAPSKAERGISPSGTSHHRGAKGGHGSSGSFPSGSPSGTLNHASGGGRATSGFHSFVSRTGTLLPTASASGYVGARRANAGYASSGSHKAERTGSHGGHHTHKSGSYTRTASGYPKQSGNA